MKTYRRDELAKRLSVSVQSIDRWRKSSKLQGVKIGNTIFFTEDAVQKFMVENTK